MGLMNYLGRKVAPRLAARYESALLESRLQTDYMAESLNAMQLELENWNYQRLTSYAPEYQFTPRHVQNIVKLAMQMAIKNPITVRSVNVQADYVFGQGVSFIAKHPVIQQVIDEFLNYRENRITLTSHTAMLRAEKRQAVYGSMFFALYTNPRTGRVIVRFIPTLEVPDIITDPEDREKEWYIQHSTVTPEGQQVTYYHPAYGIDQYSGIPAPWDVKTGSIQVPHPKGEVLWNAPVLHVAYNRIGMEKFAIPEVYPQLDWALAYKRTLEQWISIIAAYARMAMKVSGLKGRKQAAAAKALLQTSTSIANPIEGNPSAAQGSTALLGQGVDVEPVKTAGATTPASDADPILNMAGCGMGLPNTFYGDAGKGNFATAKTLDRPTELKMISRQKLWMEIFNDIIAYVLLQSVIAPEGTLRLAGVTYSEDQDVFTDAVVVTPQYPKDMDARFEVHFPEVLERNVADRVRALVNALTLFGKPLTDIVPDKKLAALWLLQALNVPNAEQYIPGFLEMWEKNMQAEPGEPVAADIIPPPPTPKGGGAEDPSQGGAVGDNG